MKIYSTGFLAALFFLTACGSKKIIVYANSDANINEEAKTITQTQTDGHVEKILQYGSGGKIVLKVTSPSGESNIEIAGKGFYIVNVKAKDTIVGGYQKFSTPEEANRIMTQEELRHNIDSLQQMMLGQNTNDANRTFFIPPNTAARISDNTDATVVGPYHQMTTIEQQGNKEPEVYRFYSIKEMRETVAKLKAHTGEQPQEEEGQK